MYDSFAGQRHKKANSDTESTFSSDRISVEDLEEKREYWMHHMHRPSTKKTYHGVWTKFNQFVLRLDYPPPTWEEKVSLYITHLLESNFKSATLKSYISGIKAKLKADGYVWRDELIWFNALTKACKLKNDVVKIRFPICNAMLDGILFEVQRHDFNVVDWINQYMRIMYTSAFTVAYHGLMRVGEYAKSIHVLKVKDVHLERRKDKYLLVLHSSKTHGPESRPQKIKIAKETGSIFCPVDELSNYIQVRPTYGSDSEQFYIFSDGSPLMPCDVRQTMRTMIDKMKLNSEFYDTHSFRIGKATDLLKKGATIESIKQAGRWKSNAVYKYLKD